jgi:glycosyltransferase involved in cell wall biosynthesis
MSGVADAPTLRLSVIIPARNEAHNLPACLATLLPQSDPDLFHLGRDWEILVIDDNSTDTTLALASELAAQHPGLRILQAPALELRATQTGAPAGRSLPGGVERAFTGKTQACWLGAQAALGHHLLFTDADTLHESGNLLRALHEAEKYHASLLSYSPRQLVSGLAQRALMPLIFSELAIVYPPAQVNDPDTRIAAANGQFILIDRETYFAVGGHRAVGRSVLEDVDLAWNVKRSKHTLRLRYAPDALSTRMYLGFADMLEGWSKNLALLFPHALALAAWRALDLALFFLPLLLIPFRYLEAWKQAILVIIWLRTLYRFYARVAKSHFPAADVALSPLALPLFIVLLLRSYLNHHILHQVAWKSREYRTGR